MGFLYCTPLPHNKNGKLFLYFDNIVPSCQAPMFHKCNKTYVERKALLS